MVVTAQTQLEDMTVSARWLSLVTIVKFVSSIMTLGMKHLKNLIEFKGMQQKDDCTYDACDKLGV